MSTPHPATRPTGGDATPTDERLQGGESVIVVRLGDAEFGLPIGAVREVLRQPELSRVPFPPPHVCGVIALRGSILPVVDLGLRLLGRAAERPGALVVAVDPESLEPIALLADGVTGMIEGGRIEPVEAPPEALATLPAGWLRGVLVPEVGRTIALLDLGLVLPNPALRSVPDA
jgi:purine-binding chemotaxis protein CheW